MKTLKFSKVVTTHDSAGLRIVPTEEVSVTLSDGVTELSMLLSLSDAYDLAENFMSHVSAWKLGENSLCNPVHFSRFNLSELGN